MTAAGAVGEAEERCGTPHAQRSKDRRQEARKDESSSAHGSGERTGMREVASADGRAHEVGMGMDGTTGKEQPVDPLDVYSHLTSCLGPSSLNVSNPSLDFSPPPIPIALFIIRQPCFDFVPPQSDPLSRSPVQTTTLLSQVPSLADCAIRRDFNTSP